LEKSTSYEDIIVIIIIIIIIDIIIVAGSLKRTMVGKPLLEGHCVEVSCKPAVCFKLYGNRDNHRIHIPVFPRQITKGVCNKFIRFITIPYPHRKFLALL
jgi:hypothetical protein